MTPRLDLNFVRSQFPAFDEASLQGQAFFDNAGGSYACSQVINHLHRYYKETKLQPYHLHPASQKAGAQMDLAHQRLADYLNVTSEEVHLGPSTSQNTYVLANAFVNMLQVGDEIIVTNQDHEANSGVWRRLGLRGITIKEWQVDPATGQLDIDQLDVLFTSKTKLLVFPHCSNIIAHINPVAEICKKAKQAGVHTLVDGVSYVGHEMPDIDALGADIYLFSLYKVFGPHLGVMVIRSGIASILGNQSHYFNEAYKHKWFVPAGPDHAQVAASKGVIDYFEALHDHHYEYTDSTQEKAERVRSLIHAAETPLLSKVLSFVDHHPNATLLGPSSPSTRAAVIALVPKHQSPQELAQSLTEQGIICGAGHFYSVRLLEAMGIDPASGVLRLSFVHYTSEAEVDQLLTALECSL
ncbi:aminotransferase class V-fold PLP-dependent enzyme [Marinomonas sp. 15G1-11]|uniref:Aminotransferase class V-fold PLP-dependent enzyme n=1 Tax=Marinomonas phaeophyticola TaxID=3004091 RepID=A0ABT4JTX1_9GAMM|nr:aminotransferase class V-fold PLP-dependent enzyme [Marinomonas sp. 15G1-11]MCZ2721807.1 aminotransferase class V-fold PLP-dependent enzyme [Marinomonas sp. 15G1-11]